MFDDFFNLANKSNLVGGLQYDLTQFLDNLVVAYFLGLTCMLVLYCLSLWSKKNTLYSLLIGHA